MIRELLAKKQALQMELRQRAATGSNMYYGSRLAISLLTQRGAARVALAAGPGLMVIILFEYLFLIKLYIRVFFCCNLFSFLPFKLIFR